MIMLYPIVYTVICICLIGNRLGPLQGGREGGGRTPGPGDLRWMSKYAKPSTLRPWRAARCGGESGWEGGGCETPKDPETLDQGD